MRAKTAETKTAETKTAPYRRAGPAGFLPAGFVLAAAMGGACATPPKPPELEALEKMRGDPAANAAAKADQNRVSNADALLARAQEEWKDSDLEEARNSALLGQVKLKHALAVAEQQRAQQRIAAAEAEFRAAQEEYERLQRDHSAVKEQVALLQRLEEAAVERQRLAQQLTEEQKRANDDRLRAGAADKIAEAELALKNAEAVRAQQHANVPYSAAVDNLRRARGELGRGEVSAAKASAEMSKIKAEEAAALAKPRHEQESQVEENRARAEALARDAAALAGVVVRREARGSLQRLVIPIQAERLFDRRSASISPNKEVVLDPIAALLKKYPSYPVQVVGYTDNRGRTAEKLAFSLARAESVFSGLVLRGVDPKRLVVSGQGSADPVADNRTAAGRSQNHRIEIVFLYQ